MPAPTPPLTGAPLPSYDRPTGQIGGEVLAFGEEILIVQHASVRRRGRPAVVTGSIRGSVFAAIAIGLALSAMIAPASRADDSEALLARFETMVRFNLDNPHVVPSARLDSLATAWAPLALGDRVAKWARWFLARGDVRYVYGRSPDGYVTEGRLCQDFATDCILFMYRTTELARSASAREAVQFAFGTRFYGASVERAVRPDGQVDYDDPAHLEYSEEMIRSGIWGADVTADCGAALRDSIGSSHAPPDTVRFLPTGGIDYAKLRSGDIVWFVGDESAPGATEQRHEGTMIHHLGILARDGDRVMLVHPAMRPLPGVYDRTGLVEVPLATYLSRVSRFKGILVSRLQEF
jgi:hypothetical protein